MLTVLLLCVTCSTPSPAELFRLAVSSRTGLVTGELEVTVKAGSANGPQQVRQRSYTLHHWWSGKSARGDVTPDFGHEPAVRNVQCRNCEGNGNGVWYLEKERKSVVVFPLSRDRALPTPFAGDVRVIGFIAAKLSAAISLKSLDNVFNSAEVASESVAQVELAGRPCWRVSRTPRTGQGEGNVWIDPSRGHSVVRVEAVAVTSAGHRVHAAESEVELVAGTDCWYPKRVVYTETLGEDEQFREVADMTRARLNVPIPPETFTVSGIGAMVGTGVAYPDGQVKHIYPGGKVGPYVDPRTQPGFQPPEPTPVGPPARRVNPWLVAVCIASALTAAGLLLLRRTRR